MLGTPKILAATWISDFWYSSVRVRLLMLPPPTLNTTSAERIAAITMRASACIGGSTPSRASAQDARKVAHRNAARPERYRSGRAAFRCATFLASCALARLGVDPPIQAEARMVIAAIRSADVVFNVGGGNINSLTLTELYQKSLIHVAARILGVPSILSGQTIGPFDRPLHETMVRFALNGVEMITLRETSTSRSVIISTPF